MYILIFVCNSMISPNIFNVVLIYDVLTLVDRKENAL